MITKTNRRLRLKKRIRKKVFGYGDRLRLSIFRSNTAIYAQLIDDEQGVTVVSSSSRIKELEKLKLTKTEKSNLVGKKLAQKAKAKGVTKVVFDRNGYKYHGRVKALAEGAREEGLVF